MKGFLLVLGVVCLTGSSVLAQEKTKNERTMVDVRHGSAKNLAETLNKHFKSETDFQAVPEETSNVLLLNGSKAVIAEAKEVLERLDRAPRQVKFEVWIAEMAPPGTGVEVAGKTMEGPLGEIKTRLEELHRKGTISTLRRYEFNARENQVTTLTHSENKPFVTGVSGRPGGPKQMSVQFRSIGIKFSATVRIAPSGEASLDLNLADSRPHVAADAPILGNDEAGAPIRAADMISTMVDAKLSLRPGHAVPVQGVVTRSKAGTGQTLIVVGMSSREMKGK